MNNSKTLKFKIATTVIFAIFVAVCLTAGIVYAAFAVPTTSIVTGVPTARLYSELWETSSGGSPLNSVANASGSSAKPIYVSSTSNNGQNVTIPYCVMRVAVSPTVSTSTPLSAIFDFEDGEQDESNLWTLQDNGWYYYNGLVGNNAGSDVRVLIGNLQQGYDVHIIVELMQFASQSDGFAELWSPLAGRNASTLISDKKATNGNDIVVNAASLGGGMFVPYAGKKQFMSHTGTVNINDVVTTNVITNAMDAGGSATLSLASLNTTSDQTTDYLEIYNNTLVPVVLLMQVTPTIVEVTDTATTSDDGVTTHTYTSSLDSVGSIGSFSFGDDNSFLSDFELNYVSGTLYMVSKNYIMPGEFMDTLPETITFTTNNAIPAATEPVPVLNKPNQTTSTAHAVYLNLRINIIDVDSLEYTFETIQRCEASSDPADQTYAETLKNAGFSQYYKIWSSSGSTLPTVLQSKYYLWLDKIRANVNSINQEITDTALKLKMPEYTKLQEKIENTNATSTYAL